MHIFSIGNVFNLILTVRLSNTSLSLFDQGPWKKLRDRTRSGHGDIHLTRLFEALKQTALSSKVCGPVVTYTSSLNRWIKFARDNNLVVFAVNVVDVALYFSYFSSSQVSAFVMDTGVCALKWIHDIVLLVSHFVRNVVDGANRQNAKPVVKKSPIFPEYEHFRELPIRRDIFLWSGLVSFSCALPPPLG